MGRICTLVGKGSGQKPGNIDSLPSLSYGECNWLQTKGQHRPASVGQEGLFMSGTLEDCEHGCYLVFMYMGVSLNL